VREAGAVLRKWSGLTREIKRSPSMTELLNAVLEAHGGLDSWRGVRAIDLRFNFSGAGLALKGHPHHLQPSATIDVKGCRSVFQRLGGDPDERWIFTSDRVWIERRDGEIIEERHHPRDAFAGHVWETKWDNLHLTYFVGYALWNYLTVPFLLVDPGFQTRELGEHQESNETWRVLEVVYPDGVPAHTKVQKLYFGPDLLLRRLDYKTDVAGGVASHYCYDYRAVDGIMFPTLRRIVGRQDDVAKVAGRTGFLLDYIDIALRR
jgi:hypothetical protein